MVQWGKLNTNARPGFNNINHGLFIDGIQQEFLIDEEAYEIKNAFALDNRGRKYFNYRLDNEDVAADGFFRIRATTRDYNRLTDLDLSDFTETVQAEKLVGARSEAQIDMTTPIANALYTALLVEFRKLAGGDDWNLTGIIRLN